MTTTSFHLSPWGTDHTAVIEAWGHDRRAALQAGLDAALFLMLGEDMQSLGEPGAVVPLRGEGDNVPALFADLLDDLFAQIAVHGPVRAAALDGVLKRDREGVVAWGYLSPQVNMTPQVTFDRAGNVEAVVETPEEIRLRVTVRRLGWGVDCPLRC